MGFGFFDVSIRGFAAILRLKEEVLQFQSLKDQPVIEEFIPLKGDQPDEETEKRKTRKWLSSSQLWNTNFNFVDDEISNPKSNVNLVTFNRDLIVKLFLFWS